MNVNLWMDHTSKMLLFEWLPLTYFTMAAIFSPKDKQGCYDFTIKVTE